MKKLKLKKLSGIATSVLCQINYEEFKKGNIIFFKNKFKENPNEILKYNGCGLKTFLEISKFLGLSKEPSFPKDGLKMFANYRLINLQTYDVEWKLKHVPEVKSVPVVVITLEEYNLLKEKK